MASEGIRVHPAVLAARSQLSSGRARAATLHQNGGSGVEVCRALSDAIDGVMLGLYHAALAELWETEGLTLVDQAGLIAHSGYGRREMALGSDVDILLLYTPQAEKAATFVSKWLAGKVFDAGLQFGFAARTLNNVNEMAMSDATVFTGLIEGRLLHGEQPLFEQMGERLSRLASRSRRQILASVLEARGDERAKHGDTVNLLQPNVKRSRGALRDLQLIRWVGFVLYQEREAEALAEKGAFSAAEARKLLAARNFLLRLRNEMHYHAGRSVDVLDRAEQVRIAEAFGYQGQPGLLPVEEFMREYFRHCSDVSDIVDQLLSRAQPELKLQSLLRPLFSYVVERDYQVGTSTVSVTRSGLKKLEGNLGEVMRLVELAALSDKAIDPQSWEAVTQATAIALEGSSIDVLGEEIVKRFLGLLSQSRRLGELLRSLHRLRVLEHLVPGMDHARGLLQFNDYHKFTVDEHSIRTVEAVASFLDDPGPLGDAYRAIRQKRILHLAALMHDLGKGYDEDHSEVGKRLAEQAAERFDLPPDEANALIFLVHKHLRMNHLAQQFDIHDPRVVVPFAAEVGSPDVLRMLFVLTCADLAAVGPGVLTDWKKRLLSDLYRHTLALISSDSPEQAVDRLVRPKREAIEKLAVTRDDLPWWKQQIDALPIAYLMNIDPKQLVNELDDLRTLPHDRARAWGKYNPQLSAIEYTVGTWEGVAAGIFHRLAGTLSSLHHSILGAEVHTLAGGLVLDRFYVQDGDFNGEPPAHRIDMVGEALVESLTAPTEKQPKFRQVWASAGTTAADHAPVPTKIQFDNDSSDTHTIIAIFAYDRVGLLYSISRALFELGLSVGVAKISTHLDQVVDVFYVTDVATNQRIVDPDRLETIRARLLRELDA